jgi:hypothetical protein
MASLSYNGISQALQTLNDKIRIDISHILVSPILKYSVTQPCHVITFEYILLTTKLYLVMTLKCKSITV